MELYEALKRIEEIAVGDKEQEAFDRICQAMDTYRALYEGAEKRLMKFRDIAGRPDLSFKSLNKDFYRDVQTAKAIYSQSDSNLSFEEWLFADSESGACQDKGETER